MLTIVVVPEMKLSPNVGSDRSWVWNAAADVSEGEPEAQTLAIRFANSESMFITFLEYTQVNFLSRRQPLQRGIHQGPTGKRASLRSILLSRSHRSHLILTLPDSKTAITHTTTNVTNPTLHEFLSDTP